MVAPTFPPGVTAQGNIKLLFTPTASLTAPSLATITGAGSFDISCYLYNWAPTAETNKVTPPRRVCSKKQFQKSGTTTESIPDVQYVVDPQGASGSDGIKAVEELPEGTEGYIVERLGIDVNEDFAVGDFVVVRHVIMQYGYIAGDPSDEANEFTYNQTVDLLAPGAGPRVALVA